MELNAILVESRRGNRAVVTFCLSPDQYREPPLLRTACCARIDTDSPKLLFVFQFFAEFNVLRRALEFPTRVEAGQYGVDIVGAHFFGGFNALRGGLRQVLAFVCHLERMLELSRGNLHQH